MVPPLGGRMDAAASVAPCLGSLSFALGLGLCCHSVIRDMDVVSLGRGRRCCVIERDAPLFVVTA